MPSGTSPAIRHAIAYERCGCTRANASERSGNGKWVATTMWSASIGRRACGRTSRRGRRACARRPRAAGRQRLQVLQGVELGLIVEPHGPATPNGSGVERHERGGQAGVGRRLRLVLGLGAGIRPRVGRPAAKVAVDPVTRDARRDPLQRRLVGVAVEPGGIGAVLGPQLRVDQPVLGGDLAGGVAGDAVADPIGLDQHHGNAGLGQQERGRDADDPAADHGHVVRTLRSSAGTTARRAPSRARSSPSSAQRQLLQAHQRLRVAQPW